MAIRVSFRKHRESNGEVTLYARLKIPERRGGKIIHRYTLKEALILARGQRLDK